MNRDLAVMTAAPPDPLVEARGAVAVGVYVSATRCVLTYVVAPSLGLFGLLDVALGAVGLVLQLLGLVSSVWGARQLHRMGSRWWPAYAAVAAAVAVSTAIALGGLA